MSEYAALGVPPVINAVARLTKFGGSIMHPQVVAAMNEAARHYVDMHDYQRKAGERIAELTRNEAAYVTTGAAAGMVVATLACSIGNDLHALARTVAGERPPRDEVIMFGCQRMPYDTAVRLAGARIVTVGNALQVFDWEFEAAFNERTAMVLFVAGAHFAKGALSLERTVEIAHAHGVPVVVDGAAQLPPVENLWRYTREQGADLAVFSGGKDLRGPQASGLVLGKRELIETCRMHGTPHQRLGRPMKVGKEELAGVLEAVSIYVNTDHEARVAGFEATVEGWIERLGSIPGVTASRAFPNEAGQPTPRLRLDIDPNVTGVSAEQTQARLIEEEPRVAVDAFSGALWVTPDCLEAGEEDIVAERVGQVLAGSLVAAGS